MATKKSTAPNLEKAIEKMAVGGHNQFADCFANFLDLALSFFCNNMDERQMQLRKRVEEDENFKNAYKEAITAFGDEAEDYHDPLGDIFMSRISHGDHGQFFTPESISLLMSEIIMDDKIHDGMSINDPACGTGRTLFMALKHLRESKHVEPTLYANDLSMTCAKMTLLNFCINSVDGAVTCGDALRLDYENFTFFKLDKVRNLTTGAVLTTYWQYTISDVEKVQEKREKWWLWIAEHGWVKYFKLPKAEDEAIVTEDGVEIIDVDKFECQITKKGKELIKEKQQIDPLPTEIKTDENGQLKLFN
jgi:hypothetical protein